MLANVGAPRTGAELIEQAIREFGVRTVFAVAGALQHRLLDQLDRSGYRIIGTRTEGGCIAAADGYARVTGRPGVALVISGHGVMNGLAALATAHEAGSPVVVIAVRPSFGSEQPISASSTDDVGALNACCKWVATVHSTQQLYDFGTTACRVALSGRPGPVTLIIPAGALSNGWATTTVDGARFEESRTPVVPQAGNAMLAQMAESLSSATRPLVLVGEGVRWAKAGHEVGEFLNATQLPFVAEGLGRGLVSEDLELGFPWAIAQVAVDQADVVLGLGCRFDRRWGFGKPPWFSPSAQFLLITNVVDDTSFGPAARAVHAGNLTSAVDGLAYALATRGWRARDTGWLRARLAPRLQRITDVANGEEPYRPYEVARCLDRKLAGHLIFVGDGADALNWMRGLLMLTEGAVWIDHQPFGSMGVGVPLALGASAGEAEVANDEERPVRPTVVVTGDGAFGYHLAELETSSRCEVPITVVVINDGGWGTERHFQLQRLGRTVNTELQKAHYELVAQGLEVAGLVATSPSDIEQALSSALDSGKTTLINVITDPMAGRLRKDDPLLEMSFHDPERLLVAHSRLDSINASS
jgi:acetolactate synthase I/II/III large subunit